jgi:hypothetical protein
MVSHSAVHHRHCLLAHRNHSLEHDMNEAENLHVSWRKMRPVFLAGVLFWCLVWFAVANAETVTLTCTAPTKNTDGSAITKPLTYAAYWGTSATTLTNAVALAGPGCKGTVSVPDPPAGSSVTYHFSVTATVDGIESAKSNVATKTVTTPKPTPLPPVLTTVGGEVFIASPNWSNFSWKLGAVAGTVAKGIKCDTTRRIGVDYYRVTSAIVWTGAKKDYVVARCA